MPPRHPLLTKLSTCGSRTVFVLLVLATPAHAATTRNVPSQYATIQAAINAAVNGDVVLLAPGLYKESVTITNKAITLASNFYTTGDTSYVRTTVIDGKGLGWVVKVMPTLMPTLVGLTLQNASDGVRAYGKLRFLDGHITKTGDGIDYEGGAGGTVLRSLFDFNTDDGIDVDNAVIATIQDNMIQDNGDDGIEIRLQPYTGPRLYITIHRNTIARNQEDGIQLISSNIVTPRTIRIEGNLILSNRMAGIGMMCCENTIENFSGANLLEQVGIYNNTICGNDYGITGGDSTVVLNNLILQSKHVGMKNVNAGSYTAHNLLFGNTPNLMACNVDSATTLFDDPLLQSNWSVASQSPAMDYGLIVYEKDGEVLWERDSDEYWGSAPELGAIETLAVTGVEPGEVDSRVELAPPVPNPGVGAIRLRASLARAGHVRLDILDVSGRLVHTIVDADLTPGPVEWSWDGRDASGARATAGVYFARLRTPAGLHTRRIVKLR